MKKLLLSSIVLFLFSASMFLFQMSCKKQANADTSPTTGGVTQRNLIVYAKEISRGIGNDGAGEIWLANLDGSNQRKVAIQLPTDENWPENPRLSPDGKTIVFNVGTKTNAVHLYSCSIDGSNVKKLISGSDAGNYNYERIRIGGVY